MTRGVSTKRDVLFGDQSEKSIKISVWEIHFPALDELMRDRMPILALKGVYVSKDDTYGITGSLSSSGRVDLGPLSSASPARSALDQWVAAQAGGLRWATLSQSVLTDAQRFAREAVPFA